MVSLMHLKANLHNCTKMHASHYIFKMQFLPRKERKERKKEKCQIDILNSIWNDVSNEESLNLNRSWRRSLIGHYSKFKMNFQNEKSLTRKCRRRSRIRRLLKVKMNFQNERSLIIRRLEWGAIEWWDDLNWSFDLALERDKKLQSCCKMCLWCKRLTWRRWQKVRRTKLCMQGQNEKKTPLVFKKHLTHCSSCWMEWETS